MKKVRIRVEIINKIKEEKSKIKEIQNLFSKRSTKLTNFYLEWPWKRLKLLKYGMKGCITTDLAEVKKIVRDYYRMIHLHTNQSIDKLDKFLARLKWTQLTQEEIENLKRVWIKT